MLRGDARHSGTIALVFLLTVGSACGGGEGRPNVLLISIDSLRRDHVTPYGVPSALAPSVPTTPSISALADEGVLFEDAVSTTSWTLPSHAALFTGLPDELHGLVHPERRLDPALDTLSELFERAGYATGGFYSGPNLHPAFGFVQGFATTYENCGNFRAGLELFETDADGRFLNVHAASHRGLTSDRVLARSSEWIAERTADSERPFFAFVHWWDPHYDYVAPPAYERLFDADYAGDVTGDDFIATQRSYTSRDILHLRALYDAEIRYTDERIGKLLTLLDEAGVGDDTIVVVVGDHGDEFYEHGKKGHQREFWEEVVRIPMVLRWRGGPVPAGERARGQARIQDVYATLADLCDLAVPDYVEAQSLRTLWENPSHPGYPQPLHLELPDKGIQLVGLRRPGLKIWWDPVAKSGVLFDLTADPGEQSPYEFGDLSQVLFGSDPGVTELFESQEDLERRRALVPRTEGLEAEPLPASIRTALEQLGYIDGAKDAAE